MRTYTRKPQYQHYQLIEGVEELCRLCLEKSEEMVPIFSDSCNNYNPLSIRIMVCVGFEVTQESNLPKNICKKCHTVLQELYTFRKMCKMSYQRLKSHTLAVKEAALKKHIINPVKDVEQNKINHQTSVVTVEGMEESSEPILLILNDDQFQHSNNELVINGVTLCQEDRLNLNNNTVSTCVPLSILGNENDTEANNELQVDINVIRDMTSNKELDAYQHNNDITALPSDNNTVPNTEIEIERSKQSQNEHDVDAISQQGELRNLPSMLSNLLVNMGLLEKQDGNLTFANDMRTLQLNSEDGNYVVIELTEETPENEIIKLVKKETSDSCDKSCSDGEQTAQTGHIYSYYLKDGKTLSDESKGTGRCEQRYKCLICDACLSSTSTLRRHMYVHTGVRPYVCEHARCGLSFSQKTTRDRHQLVHSKERPFKCAQCPKSYTQRHALATHVATHSPRRPLALHKCPLCHKVFMHASGVSRHMLLHKQRVFQCSVCSRSFRDRSSLTRHIRSMLHK